MQVQNKKRARVFKLIAKNFMGAEIIEIDFETGKPCILYGKNGAGKSSGTKGFYMAMKGRKGLPFKIDNPVGPYSTKGIKKGEIDIGIESKTGEEILELDGVKLKKLFVHFSITEKGSISLKVTDDITGTVHTSAPRDKISELIGMFLDPLELVKTLEEAYGDRKLAEKVCTMAGLDLKPYVEREALLFEQFQDENRELKRQQGVFDSLDEPQDDWAEEYTDPAKISGQLQDLNGLRNRNERRALMISEEYKVLDRLETSSLDLSTEITSIEEEQKTLSKRLEDQMNDLNAKKESLVTLQEEKKPVEWDGTQDIEGEIKRLTEELAKYRKYEKEEQEKKQAIEDAQKSIEMDTERLEMATKEVSEKAKVIGNKRLEKEKHGHALTEQYIKVDNSHDENAMEAWKGEADPTGKLFPIIYLTEKMNQVTIRNEQYQDRIAYDQAEKGLITIRNSIKDIEDKRKKNAEEKSKAVASVKEKFPHPGITVDENTVWVDMDDRRGKRTINDLSDGEKLTICTHILIAGNTGKLDILIVRDGSSLDSDSQRIIFDIAAEHDYTVILETIETSEAGALHIVDGRVGSVNPAISADEKPVLEEGKQEDHGFTW